MQVITVVFRELGCGVQSISQWQLEPELVSRHRRRPRVPVLQFHPNHHRCQSWARLSPIPLLNPHRYSTLTSSFCELPVPSLVFAASSCQPHASALQNEPDYSIDHPRHSRRSSHSLECSASERHDQEWSPLDQVAWMQLKREQRLMRCYCFLLYARKAPMSALGRLSSLR